MDAAEQGHGQRTRGRRIGSGLVEGKVGRGRAQERDDTESNRRRERERRVGIELG